MRPWDQRVSVQLWYSDKPYDVPKNGHEEVFKRVARRASSRGLTEECIKFSNEEHKRVVKSLNSSETVPKHGLGALDTLPNELIETVLIEHLDLRTLFHFRQVNRKAQQFVHTLPKFQLLVKSSLDAVCALLRRSLARKITLQHIFELFCSTTCGVCDKWYGSLIYLPQIIRICPNCTRPGRKSDIGMLLADAAEKLFGIEFSPEEEKALLPRLYPYRVTNRDYRIQRLISFKAAIEKYRECVARGSHYGGTFAFLRSRESLNRADVPPQACCPFPASYDTRGARISRSVSSEGCANLFRRVGKKALADVFAEGKDAIMSHYAEHEFLEHFRWCRPAQVLYEVNEGCKPGGIADLLNRERWYRTSGVPTSRLRSMSRRKEMKLPLQYLWEKRMISLGLLPRSR